MTAGAVPTWRGICCRSPKTRTNRHHTEITAEIKSAAGPVAAEVVCVELVFGELLVRLTSYSRANETKVCCDKICYIRC